MKTFRSWFADYIASGEYDRRDLHENIEDAYTAARDGMIPAENAIHLPPESEWPEWAKSTVVRFSRFEEECGKSNNILTVVHRTKPQPIKMSLKEALERLEGVMGNPVVIE